MSILKIKQLKTSPEIWPNFHNCISCNASLPSERQSHCFECEPYGKYPSEQETQLAKVLISTRR